MNRIKKGKKMSIKIYDFYKINEDYSTINTKIKQLRKEIFKEAGKLYQEEFVEVLTNFVDGSIENIDGEEKRKNKLEIKLKNDFNDLREYAYRTNQKYKELLEKLNNSENLLEEEVKLKKEILDSIEKYKTEVFEEELNNIKNKKNKSDVEKIEGLVEEMYKKGKNFNVSYFDIFYNSLVLYEHNGEFYIKLFMRDYAKEIFLEIFENIEDKYYQNSYDKPDEISEEEWESRRKVIEEVLLPYGQFREGGLVADFDIELFLLKWDFHRKEEFKKLIPSDERRKITIAKRKIYEEYMKDIDKNIPIHKRMNKYSEYTQTDDFEEKMEEVIKTIELKNIEEVIDNE